MSSSPKRNRLKPSLSPSLGLSHTRWNLKATPNMSPSGLEEGATSHHSTASESYFKEDTSLSSGNKEERTEPYSQGITTKTTSSISSNTIPNYPTLKLVCLAALIIFSTLTAQATAPAVLHNRVAVLALLPVQFLLLALSIFVTSRIKPRGAFHLRLLGAEGERSEMRILAALSVLVGLGGLWEGRLLDGKIWEAVEVCLCYHDCIRPSS